MHDSPGTSPLRVLIIDDHEISRAALGALLRTEGADVIDLAHGQQTIGEADALAPDVVVVDVSPGDANAVTLARELRALPHGPAVVLTSSNDRSSFGEELDGFGFIAKARICADELSLHRDNVNSERGEGR